MMASEVLPGNSNESESPEAPTSAESHEQVAGENSGSQKQSPPTSRESQEDGVVNPATASEDTLKQASRKVEKPKVIVRIKPTPSMEDNIFDVDTETKTIQIRVDRETKSSDMRPNVFKGGHSFLYFTAEDILDNSSQEDTFRVVGADVVDKAMEGTSGIIVAVGPEGSGKTFSLFGLAGRYKNRGIAARMMERLFEAKQRKINETDFHIGLGIIEVRRDRVRDLLTLSPYEINDMGERGPRGMYVEELDCLEHGLGLLLRALAGQKLIHKDQFELYHTIMYLEIVALSPMIPSEVQFRSRITLAEIAFAPQREGPQTPIDEDQFSGCLTLPVPILKPEMPSKTKQSPFPPRKCRNPAYASGPLSESIAVRRDAFALEQIFLKANEMHRIRKYFSKLEALGLSMVASEKRKLSNSNNFRQSRLAHCLKDILEGNTEIRIFLHVMPNKSSLKSSLEAMRFAERARLVPQNSFLDKKLKNKGRTDEEILQEVITDIVPELSQQSNVEALDSEKMKAIQEQAVQYFENNIDSMKVCSKDKVKQLFDHFRILWNFLWELEVNMSVRKAEEELRTNLQNQEMQAAQNRRRSSYRYKENGNETMWDEDDRHGKKSARRLKKEREREKKKRKDRRKSEDVKNIMSSEQQQENKGSMTTEMVDEAETASNPKMLDEEEEEEEAIVQQREGSLVNPLEPLVAPNIIEGETSVDVDAERRPSAEQFTQTATGETEQALVADSIADTGSVGLRGSQDEVQANEMSEEEKNAWAAKMEQIISGQFEEMKKIARRQAVHLLRSGLEKPKWTTLF